MQASRTCTAYIVAFAAFTFICVMAYALKFPWETLMYLEFHLLTNAADVAAVAVVGTDGVAFIHLFVLSVRKTHIHFVKWNGNGKYDRNEKKKNSFVASANVLKMLNRRKRKIQPQAK